MCTALPALTLVIWALLIMAGLSAADTVVPFLFAEAMAFGAYAVGVNKRMGTRTRRKGRR